MVIRIHRTRSSSDEKIGNVTTFLRRLEALDVSADRVFYFRGHSDRAYELKPYLYRKDIWVANEQTMYRELVVKCPNDFATAGPTFQKLVRMQHYSLPTRLLDITENPLIALFFACNGGAPGVDAEVVAFSVPKREIKYYDSDTVSVIANLAKRPVEFEIDSIKHLKAPQFNRKEQIEYLLHEIRQEKPAFLPKVKPDHLESVVCVKPLLDNPRIIRQMGAFFLFGINGSKKDFARMPHDYVYKPEGKPLIINSKAKGKIIDQLKKLGITRASLFPEIDSIATDIKEVYDIGS